MQFCTSVATAAPSGASHRNGTFSRDDRQVRVPRSGPAVFLSVLLLLPAAGAWGREPPAAGGEDNTVGSRIVWLRDARENEFPALRNPGEGGGGSEAVLMLHDLGSYADDPRLIQPLHGGLAGRGWPVLVPRLPALQPDATPAQYRRLLERTKERLEIGLEYLREQGYRRFWIVGHGIGAFAAAHWLAGQSRPEIAGLVMVNAHWHAYPEGRMEMLRILQEQLAPVLDVYGEHAPSQVSEFAANRKRALLRNVHFDTRQVTIPYGNHWLARLHEPLLRALGNWFAAVSAPQPPTESPPPTDGNRESD